MIREIISHVKFRNRVCSSVGTERLNVCVSMFVLCVVECCVCEAECVWHGARPPCEQQLFVDTGSVLGGWGRRGRRQGDLLSEAADRRKRSQLNGSMLLKSRLEKP